MKKLTITLKDEGGLVESRIWTDSKAALLKNDWNEVVRSILQ